MNKAKKSLIKKIIFLTPIILAIANLNALIDFFIHPEIPYLDEAHLIVGGITAIITAVLFGGFILYRQRLENAFYTRIRTEDALRESEIFLKSVFDSIQDGISILDKDLSIISVN